MPKKKKKTRTKTIRRVIKGKSIKVIEPEAILEREIADEDRDLRRAKVTEILGGFRKDREKRQEELRKFMNDLRTQRLKRREAMQKFMQGLRSKVLTKKKMMPEVRI